eukprot:Nk52_evm17s1569 gene=Nk52_evmTU17s1569
MNGARLCWEVEQPQRETGPGSESGVGEERDPPAYGAEGEEGMEEKEAVSDLTGRVEQVLLCNERELDEVGDHMPSRIVNGQDPAALAVPGMSQQGGEEEKRKEDQPQENEKMSGNVEGRGFGLQGEYGEEGEEEEEEEPIRWRRGQVLGTGAFGKVYLGLNLLSGEMMAVKQVPLVPECMGQVKALVKEIQILRDLDHPHIVNYLGCDCQNRNLNIFLEYVPGGTVSNLIANFGSLTERISAVYCRQILLGLEYLHMNDIVHLDIKGANILVDSSGCVKIADFGASRMEASLHGSASSMSLRGTPYWMAPEVIRQKEYGTPADMWSVGCTLIEMLTGKPPFYQYKDHVSAIFHIASQNGNPEIPSDVSQPCVELLELFFKRDPAQRISASDAVEHAFITTNCGGRGSFSNSSANSTLRMDFLVNSNPMARGSYLGSGSTFSSNSMSSESIYNSTESFGNQSGMWFSGSCNSMGQEQGYRVQRQESSSSCGSSGSITGFYKANPLYSQSAEIQHGVVVRPQQRSYSRASSLTDSAVGLGGSAGSLKSSPKAMASPAQSEQGGVDGQNTSSAYVLSPAHYVNNTSQCPLTPKSWEQGSCEGGCATRMAQSSGCSCMLNRTAPNLPLLKSSSIEMESSGSRLLSSTIHSGTYNSGALCHDPKHGGKRHSVHSLDRRDLPQHQSGHNPPGIVIGSTGRPHYPPTVPSPLSPRRNSMAFSEDIHPNNATQYSTISSNSLESNGVCECGGASVRKKGTQHLNPGGVVPCRACRTSERLKEYFDDQIAKSKDDRDILLYRNILRKSSSTSSASSLNAIAALAAKYSEADILGPSPNTTTATEQEEVREDIAL